MCRATRCLTCGKTTWTGCGAHIAQVRARVPAGQWCAGHERAAEGGWIRRILGR
ncbi:hypothetical protein ACFRAQ_13295 [Nocardia sp. NPDC056611]|uniref:hypothetical protein n=1 Tax=Nocardia sp. NPDC056611 TaxID=3345877 RepID=UPI0036727BB5